MQDAVCDLLVVADTKDEGVLTLVLKQYLYSIFYFRSSIFLSPTDRSVMQTC